MLSEAVTNYFQKIRGLYVIRHFFFIFLFSLGYLHENPLGETQIIIGSMFGIMFFGDVLRHIVFKNNRTVTYVTLFLSVGLLFGVQNYLTVTINYFFLGIFIIFLVDGMASFKGRMGLFYGIFVMIVSFIRFSLSYIEGFNITTISYVVLYLIIYGLLITTIYFAKYQQSEKEKNVILYNDLMSLHGKIEELVVVKERNRIARDVHDTLGHQWMAMIMQIEMASHMVKTDPEKASEILDNAKENARESMKAIRGVIETLEDVGELSLVQKLTAIIMKFEKRTGLKVTYQIKGEYEYSKGVNDCIYRLVQESLTNAVRHGKADNCSVDIVLKEKMITFEIQDDGRGAESITPGFGLKGMMDRIKHFDGEVIFESDNGFKTSGFIRIKKTR